MVGVALQKREATEGGGSRAEGKPGGAEERFAGTPAGSGKAAGAGPGTFTVYVCITLRYSLRIPAAGAREIL